MLATAAPHPAITAPATAPSTTAGLVELLVLNMLQQLQALMAAKPMLPSAGTRVFSAAASSNSLIPAATAPAVLASEPCSIPSVSLDGFCARYHIDPKERARLEKMEFRPGVNLDDLGSEEWNDFGGFLPSSWSRMKAKNRDFLRDAQLGLWKDSDNAS
jgi:hypothetical protein